MREILFRGKHIATGAWEYGFYVHIPNMRGEDKHLIQTLDEDGDMGLIHSVNPATVGQCTGLTDKNGKRIFEGDILQFGGRRLMVWWNGEAFQWQAKTVAGYDYIPYEVSDTDWTNVDLGVIYSEIPILGKMTTEVIGNIHDHPELLEGGGNQK